MHDSVHGSLLSRGAGSLLRTGRSIHPNIHALNQPFGEGNVIAGQENDLADEAILLGYLDDLLDEILPCLVGGMGLAGKEELNRTLRIVHDRVQPVQIAEEQRRSLVGGEPPSETDGQYVIAQVVLDGDDLARRVVVAKSGIADPFLHDPDQACLQGFPDRPDLLVRNLVDFFKALLVIVMGREFRTEDPRMHLFPFGSSPGRIMDPVRDIADEQFLRQVTRVHIAEDLLAHLAVQHRNAVDILRDVGGKNAHRELFMDIAPVHLAQSHQGFPFHFQALRVMADVLPKEFLVKGVMTGGNRRVGGEQGGGPDDFQGFSEV